VTDSAWEDNISRLLKNGSRPLTDRQIEESVARFERRIRPAPSFSRWSLASAALLFVGIVLWIVLPFQRSAHTSGGTSSGGTPGVAQEEKAKIGNGEIDPLITKLGSEEPEVREKAKTGLLAIGEGALDALDKAYYHENPNIRPVAKELARTIRERVKIQELVARVKSRIRTIRGHWVARDFKDIEQATREAFIPATLDYVHYVPRKEIGNHLEASDGNLMSRFIPLVGEGNRDLLTPEVAEALDRDDGLVFLGFPSQGPAAPRNDASPKTNARVIADWSPTFIFTLPDKKEWSAYLLVSVPEGSLTSEAQWFWEASLKSRLLASNELRQVWGIGAEEVEWAVAHQQKILEGNLAFSPTPSGLQIMGVAQGSIADIRGLKKGDLVKEVNAQPIRTLADLKTLLGKMRNETCLRIVLERAGKTIVLDYRPLPN